MDYESWKARVDKKLVFNKDTPTKLDKESKYLILKKLTLKPLILDINDFIVSEQVPDEESPSMSRTMYDDLTCEDTSPLLYKETYSSSTDSQQSLYHIYFSRIINISEKQSLTI
jgi:UV DNA damage repair endonuclease